MTRRRVNIRAIISDPEQRKRMMVGTIIATQAREGITTTEAQAEAAYDKVLNDEGATRLPEPPLRQTPAASVSEPSRRSSCP